MEGKMPNTTYVLDTSVLLYNANSIRSFGDNSVVIPYVVLEELDKFKGREDIVGTNARTVSRALNDLRKNGLLSQGVPVNDEGGILVVALNFNEPQTSLLPKINQNDDRILNVCLGLAKNVRRVVLVTQDINLAVRADVLGITAESFETDRPVDSASAIYTGTDVLVVSDSFIEGLYAGDELFPSDLGVPFYPNQYFTLTSDSVANKTALVRVVSEHTPLLRMSSKRGAWGIKPRNREQQFAIDALLDPSVCLLTLTGPAGTGKSLLSLACALQQVQEDNVYDRLVVSRPVQPLGRDIGYLPGTADEKMDPWMGPIRDALEFLIRGKKQGRDMFKEMLDLRMLNIQPLTYIRGRSMPGTLFIIDEAQDMTRAEMKTVVSRMGENSKLVLIGDVLQISNPYLHSTTSGLTNVVEKFKPYDIAAHVTLQKGERSALATIAADIL
jgi:PhoH-like ATPase